MSLDFLYLTQEDMIKAGVVDMKRCVQSMDDVFHLLGEGDYVMGGPYENSHGLMLWFPEKKRTEKMPVAGPDRRFMAMPAYLGGRFNVCGTKWYGSNVENAKKGLPRSILTVMLNDVDTGAPLALMSANLLSAARTGAVPGVGTKYLQTKDASVIGIIGAGVMSRSCLLSIAETIAVKKEVRVYDIFPEKAAAFCKEMSEQTGMDVHPVDASEKAIIDCDIVSVAASALAPVVIRDEWIKPGAVIEVTGAAEITDECYLSNTVVFDNWKMHKEWLDELRDEPERLFSINAGHPSAPILKMVADGKMDPKNCVSLGDIIKDPSKGRKSDKEKMIFLTGGMAVEDVAWGFDCYTEALRQGLGQKLSLWNETYWA